MKMITKNCLIENVTLANNFKKWYNVSTNMKTFFEKRLTFSRRIK